MFNSSILDVAMGLIFIYLLLSLMCTAANEIIELLLKKRAIDLERGIRELLDPGSPSGTNDIVQKLYNHPLINGLFGRTYEESGIASAARRIKRTQLPSYIPARNFSLALMDLIRPGVDQAGAAASQSGTADATTPSPATPSPNAPQVFINLPTGAAPVVVPAAAPTPNPSIVALRAALAANPQLTAGIRRGLIPLIDAAGNDAAKVRENIESWYNASMDRVSSWYKRRAQITILILGLFIAITVNVDTITIAKRLSTDKALRDSLVAAGDAYAKAHAAASPTPRTSPAPTPKPAVTTDTSGRAPSPSPVASPAASVTLSPSPSPVASRASGLSSSTSSPATSPSPASTTAAATPTTTSSTLPEVCKTEPTSDRCIREKSLRTACAKPESDACKEVKKIQAACLDLNSVECKRGMDYLSACEEPNSVECKRATDYLSACEEPNSLACRTASDLREACRDGESPECRYVTNLQQIRSLGLPIGWESKDDPRHIWPGTNFIDYGGWTDQIYWHGLGWLLTALALSLGAPFWFDLLNKFIVIRSAVKPHEKSPEEGSKD